MPIQHDYFPDFVANDDIRKKMGDLIETDRLAHAYLLEGKPGSGKHTLAMEVIASLTCANRSVTGAAVPCRKCASCRKIFSGNSPDIRLISREDKATLGIDSIRFLKDDVHIAPMELPVKAYIIEDAHLMTVQAQNAFLLTLEEPPAYVLFILLCERSDMLLETIRSRAPLYRLFPAGAADIKKYLTGHLPAKVSQIPSEELDQVILSAQGSIGQAMALLDAKSRKPILERRSFAESFVRCCLKKKNSAEAVTVLNGFSSKRDEACEQLAYISDAMRDLILMKRSDTVPLLFFTDTETAASYSELSTLPVLLSVWEAVENARQSLLKNGNVKLCITQLGIQSGMLS